MRPGSDLLHLALACGPGGQSLRETAAWAEVQGVASMSDVALLERLRGCSDWLGRVAGGLLARRVDPTAVDGASHLAGLKLRVVDGSVIGAPGRGANVRLQAVYDVDTQRFTHLDLMPVTTAESLERIEAGPGEVVVADRGTRRPPDCITRSMRAPIIWSGSDDARSVCATPTGRGSI